MKIKYVSLIIIIMVLFISACSVIRPKEGIFKELHGIYVIVDPINIDQYKKLLPESFSMPETPKVLLVVVDYTDVVNYWGMSPYQEGYISLLCNYKGELGWHSITMPVTKRIPMFAGRDLGFPKYIADAITLANSDNKWMGVVKHQGVDKLILEFTKNPDLNQNLTFQQKMLSLPIFQLVPPEKGSTVNKIIIENKIPAAVSADTGDVQIKIDPQLPWAGLISENLRHPGLFLKMKCGIDLLSQRMN